MTPTQRVALVEELSAIADRANGLDRNAGQGSEVEELAQLVCRLAAAVLAALPEPNEPDRWAEPPQGACPCGDPGCPNPGDCDALGHDDDGLDGAADSLPPQEQPDNIGFDQYGREVKE